MNSDDKKKGLTYEAADTIYQPEENSEDKPYQPEEDSAGTIYPPKKEAKDTPYRQEKKTAAVENWPPRPQAKPKKGSIRLDKEIRLGDFYVPAGTYSLGKGGQAQIYDCYRQGEAVSLGEADYVAKLYGRPQNSMEETILEKVRQINRTIMQLKHPNLPKLYAEDRLEDGSYVVIMKRYEPYSGFLDLEKFKGNPKMYEQVFCKEVEGLSDALQLLHRQKIYHADIKPANIMQDADAHGDRHLVLIDFGIGVQGTKTDVAVTVHGKTDTYMPPELYSMKKRKVNDATDYYSLGMTMAEFVAGRYPMQNNMQEKPADQEYLKRNEESPYRFYGLLLPEMLSDYLARFFEGTLYVSSNLSVEEVHKRRWSAARVKEWLSAIRARDYKTARSIPTGLSIAEEEAKVKGMGIHVKYDSDSQAIALYSTEEMAVMFLEHWDETIEKLLRNATWSRVFSKFGEDVAAMVEQTRREMQADMAERERIFDRTLMETYLPEHYKYGALRYRNLYYFDRKDFGKAIYELMVVEKNATKGSYRLPKQSEKEKPDMFGRMMEMFAYGTVEQFFKAHRDAWRIEDTELQLARQIRENISKNEKTMLVENLYRLSFRLQGEACLTIAEMKTTFRSNKQLLAELRRLYDKDENKAIALLHQFFDAQGLLKVDYYVFLQEAPDSAKRPKEGSRETL